MSLCFFAGRSVAGELEFGEEVHDEYDEHFQHRF